MARNLVTMNANLVVSVGVSSTRPSASSDGVDITGWRTSAPYSPPIAAVLLSGSAALTVSSPTGGSGGVEVWGYTQSAWWLVGYLNNGQAIPIAGVGQGFAQELDVIGIFDRLAVAGTPSPGSATAKLAPLDSYT